MLVALKYMIDEHHSCLMHHSTLYRTLPVHQYAVIAHFHNSSKLKLRPGLNLDQYAVIAHFHNSSKLKHKHKHKLNLTCLD